MNTVNISLTSDQLQQVNSFTNSLGFANRSEFFRALLRRLFSQPDLIKESASWPFVSPPRNKSQIISSFKKTNKYSQAFLDDLKEGLDNSKYFKQK